MSFKEYHKIETPFLRDMEGTKKLIEGKYRSEAVELTKDLPWVFTEKVDGTNIRIHWDGHHFTLGGRTDKANLPARIVEWFNNVFNDVMEELFEQMFGEKEVILYGEGYGLGIQAVGKEYLPNSNDFILFDAVVNNAFLDHEDVKNLAQTLGLKMTPVVLEGTVQDAIEFVKTKPQSLLGSCIMEGVVGRPVTNLYDKRGNRLIIKIKCKDFC